MYNKDTSGTAINTFYKTYDGLYFFINFKKARQYNII